MDSPRGAGGFYCVRQVLGTNYSVDPFDSDMPEDIFERLLKVKHKENTIEDINDFYMKMASVIHYTRFDEGYNFFEKNVNYLKRKSLPLINLLSEEFNLSDDNELIMILLKFFHRSFSLTNAQVYIPSRVFEALTNSHFPDKDKMMSYNVLGLYTIPKSIIPNIGEYFNRILKLRGETLL